MTFCVPFGCAQHYGHRIMVNHHHSQGTSWFWVPVWRRQLFGQESHMHGFRVCRVRVPVELPTFTGGTFFVEDPNLALEFFWRGTFVVTFGSASVALLKETTPKEMVGCQMGHTIGLGPWATTMVLARRWLNKVKLPKGDSKAKGKSLKLQCTCSQRVCMCFVCNRMRFGQCNWAEGKESAQSEVRAFTIRQKRKNCTGKGNLPHGKNKFTVRQK